MIAAANCGPAVCQWPPPLLYDCSLVVLSGCDDLVPAELVMAQLKLAGHPAKVC